MPILLYCIAKADALANKSLTGVACDPVIPVRVEGLSAFISSNADSSAWMKSRLRASALEFHQVLTNVFRSGAIIPFRFPTTFETETELTEHLTERSSEYTALLDKFSDLVQMEVRVTSPFKTQSESGAQYLKARQTARLAIEKFEAELRAALSSILKDWRHRASKEGIRAFALVARGGVAEFGKIMQSTPVPDGMKVRVSGPWPVSEFNQQS